MAPQMVRIKSHSKIFFSNYIAFSFAEISSIKLPRNWKESPLISNIIHCRFAIAFGEVDKIISSGEISISDLLVPLSSVRFTIRYKIVVRVFWGKLRMNNF